MGRSQDRTYLDRLMYPLAYSRGYQLDSSPYVLSINSGRPRKEGVRPMSLPFYKSAASICAHCGKEDGEKLEALFDLDMSSTLIPMRYNSLKTYLSKHRIEFPARYMLTYGHRRVRMLTAGEIKLIRMSVLRGPGRLIV